jgi:hypothetical protein
MLRNGEIEMKEVIALVLILIFVTCCQDINDIDANEKSEHNENVVSGNNIEGNVYNNDFVGIQMELSEDFEIYNYEDLNLYEEDAEVGNILLYASLSISEGIVVYESIP